MNSKVNKNIPATISDFSKIFKEAFEPYSQLQEIIRDALKPLNTIQEHLGRVIYLQPHIFKVIAGLGLAVPYDPKKDEYLNFYHIYTKYPHTNKKGLKSFSVSLESGEAIKTLIKNRTQYMFPKINQAPFNKKDSVLTINRISIEISRETGRNELCKIIFGNKKYLGKVWSIEEIAEKLGVKDLNSEKRYHYIYDKVRFLNKLIKEHTELESFLDLRDNTLTIDPIYSYTFLD